MFPLTSGQESVDKKGAEAEDILRILRFFAAKQMKYLWTIPVMLLIASSAMGDFPKMESSSFVITSSEFSGMGKYKVSESFDTWDTLGQPSPIGQWPKGTTMGSRDSGSGWIYTFNLPVWWDKDHDRDGMPLAYEEQFAEWNDHTMWDYNPYDASEDWDGDGFSNIQEYLSRSDPTDPTSFFQFTDIRLVTSEGRPLLAWWSTTTSITGFEGDYPNYPRSLGFDILYADWSVESQAGTGGQPTFPNDDWFNQTGTWQLVDGGTGLKRDGDFNTYNDNIAGGAMSEGDIRFYRLAIGQTWNEGTPEWGSWDYYSAVGSRILCSTVAGETLMIQKHVISAGADVEMLSLSGETTSSDGKLDYVLGKELFPAGSLATYGTNLNLWITQTAIETVDYLSSFGSQWRDDEGDPSVRKITAGNGFRFAWDTGHEPSAPITFYAGAQLKMDSYAHEIYRRDWNADSTVVTPGDPNWGAFTNTQATYFSYNFPVEARFISDFTPAFPKLAGTSDPTFPGWGFLESDYVMFYNRDLSAKAGGGTNETVGIYYDHAADDGTWIYFLPFSFFGDPVGTELVLSPGSPGVVIQYWNPNDAGVSGWTNFTITDPVPYQDSGNNEIKTYLKH